MGCLHGLPLEFFEFVWLMCSADVAHMARWVVLTCVARAECFCNKFVTAHRGVISMGFVARLDVRR